MNGIQAVNGFVFPVVHVVRFFGFAFTVFLGDVLVLALQNGRLRRCLPLNLWSFTWSPFCGFILPPRRVADLRLSNVCRSGLAEKAVTQLACGLGCIIFR
jgi:hypothetical protein